MRINTSTDSWQRFDPETAGSKWTGTSEVNETQIVNRGKSIKRNAAAIAKDTGLAVLPDKTIAFAAGTYGLGGGVGAAILAGVVGLAADIGEVLALPIMLAKNTLDMAIHAVAYVGKRASGKRDGEGDGSPIIENKFVPSIVEQYKAIVDR
jgi:hypothetical protein